MRLAVETGLEEDFLTLLAARLDCGGSGGKLILYDGTAPLVKGSAITTQRKVVTFILGKPCTESIAGGVLTLKPPDPAQAENSGLVTWARLTDSANAFVADLDAGPLGSGAVIEMSDPNIFSGAYVSFTLLTLRFVA